MHDTLIFLVLAGIALVFKWLSSQGSADAEKPTPPGAPSPNEPAPRTPAPRAPAQSEEERVRRFLEALGAPPGSAPPPSVRPRPVAPRRVVTPTQQTPRATIKRSWAQPLPPLVTSPEEQPLPPLTSVPDPLPPPVIVTVAPPPPPLAAPRRVVRQTPAVVAAAPRPLSLGEMLRARGSARQAIILREILGPPRGLQALDLASF